MKFNIFNIFICILLCSSLVTAHNFKLISNTDECLINCESIFEVEYNGTDKFLSKSDINLWSDNKNSETIGLENLELFIEQENSIVELRCNEYEDIKKCELNKTTHKEFCYNYSECINSIPIEYTVKKWISYNGYDLKNNEIYKFKVIGKRKKAVINDKLNQKIDWKIDMLDFQPNWAWWNNSWNKKRLITLNHSVYQEQILLNISYDVNMQTGFQDIRFTNTSENVEFDYWIQYQVNSSYVEVWVNVTGSSLYLYYDNILSNSQSNGANTFLFFDDFLNIDWVKWECIGDLVPSNINGTVYIISNSARFDGIITRTYKPPMSYEVIYKGKKHDLIANSNIGGGISDIINKGTINADLPHTFSAGLANITLLDRFNAYDNGGSNYVFLNHSDSWEYYKVNHYSNVNRKYYYNNNTMVTKVNSVVPYNYVVLFSRYHGKFWVDWIFIRRSDKWMPSYIIGNETTYVTTTTTTTTTTLGLGIIYVRVIDLTSTNYNEIIIYQNDNMSHRYIMTKNMSEMFTICSNTSYNFIAVPNTRNIIKGFDNYFLDYILGNVYFIILILVCLSGFGYLIYKKR